MARYFAINTLAGMFSRNSSVLVVESTGAGTFDSAYVSNAISTPQVSNFDVKGPFIDGSTSLTTEFWLRFDIYNGNRWAQEGLTFFTLAGANAYRMLATSVSTMQFQYWNSGTSAWVNWGASWAENTSASRLSYTVKLNPGNSFTVYRNGSAVMATGTAPTNAAANVGLFRFGSFNDLGGFYWSQIMCADYDIRESHMFSKLPVANGNYTDGTGAASDVNEVVLDDGGAINLPAVGNKRTFTKGSVTVPAGLAITSLVVNARMRVGGGVVTNAKARIRSSATDATSGNLAPGGAYEARFAEFTTDPNTGTIWGQTGFNNAEVGLEAV